jgi:hypothetical protein
VSTEYIVAIIAVNCGIKALEVRTRWEAHWHRAGWQRAGFVARECCLIAMISFDARHRTVLTDGSRGACKWVDVLVIRQQWLARSTA